MASNSQQMRPTQNIAQRQVITRKMIQSIRLMSMPLTELRETIQLEIEKNPALEIVRHAGETDDYSLPDTANPETLSADTDLFANSSDPGYQPIPKNDSDSRHNFLEGSVFREESLHDHLISQLHLLKIKQELMDLCELIIWNLDSDGFHLEDPQLLVSSADPTDPEEALKIVQGLDPFGCACRDWRESLIVQAGIRGDAPADFDTFITEALSRMENNRSDEVRNELNLTKDDWEDLENYTSILNPFPGRRFSTGSAQYIIPDLIVRMEEGEHVLVLNDEVIPVLRIDPEFEKFDDDDSGDKETRRFIQNHSREARQFLNSLTQRENTLLKTAKTIIDYQQGFFSGGPRYLKPLTRKDVANEIGVHEATVSRITTNKFIQTDWGLFELKYFFSNSISGSGTKGSQVSKVAAKELIREILLENNQEKRISDQKMSEILARRGIKLARRTVAKYRKELDFPSSFQR